LKKNAFTLIELLIVVAIIAILAAIAVPNFLEAQVRAKVSRAKADMRTLITATESYRVDNNRYPPDGDDFKAFNPMTDFDVRTRLRVLTTPVSYITSIPGDPFHVNEVPLDQRVMVLFISGPPFPFIYNTDGNFYGSPQLGSPIANNGSPTNFTYTSLGPNMEFDSVVGYQVHYDATNGTVSAGDIHHSGGSRIEREEG